MNIQEKYKKRHGYDGWPADMNDTLIDLTVAKKWRLFKEDRGIEFRDPWIPFIDATRSLLDAHYFSVSPWTEEHFHDFVMYREVITWGCASSSKAQPLDARLYTPSGYTTMGDISVGDKVFGVDGRPVRVVKTHDVGTQEEYCVTFSDRTSCLCAGSHLWEVTPRRAAGVPAVKTTEWLYNNAKPSRYYTPVCSPVKFDSRAVKIDPYVLGALLGDGSFGGSSGTNVLRFTSADSDIVDSVSAKLPSGYELRKIKDKRGYDYCIVQGTRSEKPKNEYIQALRDYGLWAKLSVDKFVPSDYLFNDTSTRISVLSGLLDTDGCVTRIGAVYFSSSSRQLAEDVAWLVRSLGGIARISTYNSSYRKCGTKVDCLPSYRVSINMPDMTGLFRCARKVARTRVLARGSSGRYIVGVTKTGRSVPMKCVTVDDPRGLYLTNDFIATHNSNDYGLMLLEDYLVDPYATVTIVGSTTKLSLRMRIWESIVRYHEALKNNRMGFVIPGHVSEIGFLISNEKVAGDPDSAGKKAAIRGVALNEDGRLQGAHLTYVRALVDELATISNFDALDKGIANLSIARDFRFYGLANPHSWDDMSCKYCLPQSGQKVDVDTGSWMSTKGIFVRHHDGLKSPAYLDSNLERDYPYLMNKRHVEENLRRVDGNWDAPLIWEQVRGFPLSTGTMAPTVLDPLIASANNIGGPPPKPFIGERRMVGRAAGVDPAWSEGGDDSIYAGCIVYEQDRKPILDFSGLIRRIPIKASSPVPVTQQQRDFVISVIRSDGGPDMKYLAVDDSGNQGLGDSLITFVGGGLLSVNNSKQASDLPIKATDSRRAREFIKDRAAEAWLVLAEFAKAGQVYGLPSGAVEGLVSRRFASRAGSSDPVTPLRLEPKEQFKLRFKGSPNETDACALAALAVKERLGIMPFGSVPAPVQASVFPGMSYAQTQSQVTNAGDGTAESGYAVSVFDESGYGSLD